tara:strand:- start:220 stop:447 length:228 start_codon:yes stop_codon:yes gene_type:complete
MERKTIQQKAQALVNLHNAMHAASTDPNKDKVFSRVKKQLLHNMQEHRATYIDAAYKSVQVSFQDNICPIDINTL